MATPKTKKRPAKKAAIAVLPDGRQMIMTRPLTGNVKERYMAWKKKHAEQETNDALSAESGQRGLQEGEENDEAEKENLS